MEKEIVEKIKRYCAYQDRAQSEVRMKLRQYDITGAAAEQMIADLQEEGYLNEERFAESFIRGRVNVKKWGREKIKSHLLAKGISADIIEALLENIDHDQYLQNLRDSIDKWLRSHPDQQKTDPALYRHLLSKGYEYQHIKTEIKNQGNA